MAYVNVAEWKAEQVTEWLKGLDSAILPYLQLFLSNEISGQQLLNVRPEDLELLGIKRLGHQELVLEAVEHLRNFHYELDRENLQLLALRLSCQAHSLHNELKRHTDSQPVSTQTLADVASVVRAVKPLVCWLDRSPFSGQLEYADRKSELLRCSLEIATCAQRDRFAERPVEEIRESCGRLAKIADGIIQDIADPLILQPASLDLATLRKRGSDDLGFFIVPSFHGVHQIGEIKFGSPAHQCGKVEEGDEVVQVNYQTVVGWQRKKVIALFEESLTDVFLTLKKRPRHTKVYGQIYMKPYRLPSKKRAPAYTRWHENLPSPRPELLTIPDFEMPLPRSLPKSPPLKHTSAEPLNTASLSTSSESDDAGSGCDEASLDYELEGHASPTSMRLYLPKPRVPVQRRATITGASPTSHRPPVDIEKFLRELKLDRRWKGSGHSQDSDVDSNILRNKSPIEQTERPSTCLGFEKSHKTFLKNVENKSSKSSEMLHSENSEMGDKEENCMMHFEKESESEHNIAEKKFSDVQTSFGTVSSTSIHSEPKKEKRFVSKLDIVVDCSDARIEFCPQSQRRMLETENPNDVSGSIVMSQESNHEGATSVESVEKARKISSESQVGDLSSYSRERGRLDKSFSTPAYDLSWLEGFEVMMLKEGRKKKQLPMPEKKEIEVVNTAEASSPDSVPSLSNSSSNSCGPSIQATNQNFTTHPVLMFPASVDTSRQSEVLLNDLGHCDLNSNPVTHGRVVETINRHLLASNHGGEDDDNSEYIDGAESPNTIKSTTCLDSSFEGDVENGNEVFGVNPPILDNCGQKFDLNQNNAQTKLPPKKPPRIVINTSSLENTNRDIDASNSQTSSESPSSKDLFLDSRRVAPVPLARLSNLPEHSEKSPVYLHPKISSKVSLSPPEPPPRPVPPSKSPSTPTEQSKPSTLRAMINSRSCISKPSLNSPKVACKKNPFLSKRRIVGVKELGTGDYQGWLYRRLRLGGNGAQWIKGWFILKGATFYGFKSREASKADCFISLPGFTISPAEEVKSKKYAFKVYHTGTVFYFAAESDEELAAWLDCLSMATLALDLNTLKASFSEGAVFSETEDESEDIEAADSCFPSPKMRKFTNFLSGHTNTSTHVTNNPSPKPARSHQNLTASGDSKTYDIQKKFGSLKKLGYRSKPHPTNSTASLSGSDQSQDLPSVSAPHSLDRKYLRFLSSSKSQNVPVPTAQFRSYRRVATSDNCHGASETVKFAENIVNNALKIDTAAADIPSLTEERSSPSLRFLNSPSSDHDVRRNGRGAATHVDDVAGLLTLEQFMLLRQEELQQNQHIFGSQTRDRGREVRERDSSLHETHEGYTEDPVSSLQRSLERHRTQSSPAVRPIPAARTLLRAVDHTGDRPTVAPRNFKVTSDGSGYRGNISSNVCKHSGETSYENNLAPNQTRLKNAAMYQPPPVAFPSSPNLGPSFEMHLDNRSTATVPSEGDQNSRAKGTGSRLRQLFSPKQNHSVPSQSQISSSLRPDVVASSGASSTHQKTLLGSPRLHRALFRHGDNRKPKVPPSSDTLVLSYPPVTASERRSTSPQSIEWIHEFSPSPKPTMGTAMLGKKPFPTTSTLSNMSSSSATCPPSSSSQTPASPPPDYPGLEYPPVFEPGTYSLSDTSSFLYQPSQTSPGVCPSKSDHSTIPQFHHK